MKKYIVGGYTRDKLLGLHPNDRDFVLVGANEWDIKQLIIQGYEQVGKDFPVYLSPQGEEYALARIERKTGNGYDGFTVETKNVTLEQDLSRRDLTINAIAFDQSKSVYIDPYGGRADLKAKVLRHVSEAFREDPLRVLRLARFSARFSDFTVHADTDAFVRSMVKNGELDHLTKERVYVEFEKAFKSDNVSLFLKYLNNIGALQVILPEYKLLQKDLKSIDHIVKNASDKYRSEFIWAILLNKVDCSKVKGGELSKMKLPMSYVKFSSLVQKHSEKFTKMRKLKAAEMVELFDLMNIKNLGGEEFLYKFTEYFLLNKELDSEYENFIVSIFDKYINIDLSDLLELQAIGSLSGLEMKQAVYELRLESIKKMF